MLTDELKRHILQQHLTTIYHISDKEYQRRIWIRGEGPEWDDFDETCCCFFGDLDIDSVLENHKDFWMTDVQYEVLKKFRDEFRKFSDDNNLPQLFIDTPEWTTITLLAKKVLEVFNYRKLEDE